MYESLTEAELSREKERLEFEHDTLEKSQTDAVRLKSVKLEIQQIEQRLAKLAGRLRPD